MDRTQFDTIADVAEGSNETADGAGLLPVSDLQLALVGGGCGELVGF